MAKRKDTEAMMFIKEYTFRISAEASIMPTFDAYIII